MLANLMDAPTRKENKASSNKSQCSMECLYQATHHRYELIIVIIIILVRIFQIHVLVVRIATYQVYKVGTKITQP